MKKLIITCALLTSASMLSFAQSTQTSATTASQPGAAPQEQAKPQRPSAEQVAERRSQMVRKQYNLDDAQYKGIYAAELEYMTKMMALRDKGQQPAPGEGQKMNEEKDQKYKAVMTPEQYEKYSATRRPSVQPNAAPAAAPASK